MITTKVKLKFKNNENNIELASLLMNKCPEGAYLAISDADNLSDKSLEESIDYCRETSQLGGMDEYFNFPIDFFPKYELINSIHIEGYGHTDYIFVKDIESLNFFLSYTGGEKVLSIFSKDFDIIKVAALETNHLDFLKTQPKNTSDMMFYKYIQKFHLDLFEGNKMALIDTYPDDEDAEHYLLISSDQFLAERVLYMDTRLLRENE